MEQLFKAISKHVKISDNLKTDLERRLKYETFEKREIVLNESQVCTKSYFIKQGILRLYYLKDGKEISEFFCAENEWINSPKSFMKQEVDEYYIDSIERSHVWSLSLSDLMHLFNHYPEMERYARMDMGSAFTYFMERLAISRFSTASEKHRHFLNTYQNIHHRIPLGMAASYIGITQETLSRLRREK